MLLSGTGLAYVTATRGLQSAWRKAAIGGALGIAFLLVWAELAVGIF
jgi:hypothetical protein